MSDPVYLRDLTGPYRGQVRPYLRHAAENALASGFAEPYEPEPEVDAESATEPEVEVKTEAPKPTPRKPRGRK